MFDLNAAIVLAEELSSANLTLFPKAPDNHPGLRPLARLGLRSAARDRNSNRHYLAHRPPQLPGILPSRNTTYHPRHSGQVPRRSCIPRTRLSPPRPPTSSSPKTRTLTGSFTPLPCSANSRPFTRSTRPCNNHSSHHPPHGLRRRHGYASPQPPFTHNTPYHPRARRRG